MHPIIRSKCSQEVILRIRIGYEDGDIIYAPGVGVSAKIFYHEARTISEAGNVYTYSTSIHIPYFEEIPDDYRMIHSVAINGVEYQVKGISEVRNPFTQKITTLVLKI